MIAYLQGEVFESGEDYVILLCGGVGYLINITAACAQQVTCGTQASFYIEESISPYGTALYGFTTKEHKALWTLFKEQVPGMGPKKALELLNKAQRSVTDFHLAITNGDAKILTGIFGFTKKTADKIILALKDKMAALPVQGESKIKVLPDGGTFKEVADALGNLGFSAAESRRAITQLYEAGFNAQSGTEILIKEALRILKK